MKTPCSIFLVGPMGAGKSAVGRQLARLLKTDFADADTEIENRTGVDIPSPEPSIRVATTDLARVVVTITVFCPTAQAVAVEQKITKDLFDLYFRNIDSRRPLSAEVTAPA